MLITLKKNIQENIFPHPTNKMYIIGISSYYHDSAAVLIKDGKVICATEEERFTRVKHDNGFPINSIKFCLKFANINISDVRYIAYYEKPLLKFERILETFIETYPKSLIPFVKSIPEWLSYKIKPIETIKRQVGFKGEIFYIPHHLSHAAVSFFPSPFKKSAILTVDGVGEYETTGLWSGDNNTIKPLKTLNFPHSLGLLYSTFTSFTGFRVNNDEYKVMGLAAYGKPIYANKIYKLIDLNKDGSFKLNLEYFSFRESFQMWSKKFEGLFGSPGKYGEALRQRNRDLAASLQAVTEEIYFKILNHLYEITEIKNLCIGGGVALNSLANGKIFEKTPFERIYNFGAAGDSGASLGAALYSYHGILGLKKRKEIRNLSLGSLCSDKEIQEVLKRKKVKYMKCRDEEELTGKAALLLRQNKIIGWFQGRMEFGPRALGNRSILANPMQRKMKDEINKIKKRENFRPFAGSILQERVHEYLEVPEKKHYSPFMNFCFKVKTEKSKFIAAIVHKDKTCRVQTVSKDNGLYYDLVKEFYKLTGIPFILNTSFNLNKEPIVERPEQAIDDFVNTRMDYLVIGDYILMK